MGNFIEVVETHEDLLINIEVSVYWERDAEDL